MAEKDYSEVDYGAGDWFRVTDEDIDMTDEDICDRRRDELKQRKRELTYKVCEHLLENHWQEAMDTVIQDVLNPIMGLQPVNHADFYPRDLRNQTMETK